MNIKQKQTDIENAYGYQKGKAGRGINRDYEIDRYARYTLYKINNKGLLYSPGASHHPVMTYSGQARTWRTTCLTHISVGIYLFYRHTYIHTEIYVYRWNERNVVNHLHFSKKVPNSRRAHFLIKKLILFKFKWLVAIKIKYFYITLKHFCLPHQNGHLKVHLSISVFSQKPWRATAGVSSVSASPGWPATWDEVWNRSLPLPG